MTIILARSALFGVAAAVLLVALVTLTRAAFADARGQHVTPHYWMAILCAALGVFCVELAARM